jgi:hypothetical protein
MAFSIPVNGRIGGKERFHNQKLSETADDDFHISLTSARFGAKTADFEDRDGVSSLFSVEALLNQQNSD